MAKVTLREGVARGTMVVAVTTLIIRVMGAVYRPVVVHLFRPYDGAEGLAGIGLTQAPSSAYSIILSFTSIGFNVALARLIADAMARDDRLGARRIFDTSLTIMAVLGAIGAILLALASPWLAAASKMGGTALGYVATAPALFLISIVAAYRGLFQGLQAQTSNAQSQLLEAVVRNTAGIALVYLLAPHSVIWGAAGFNLGDAFGAIASLSYLFWVYQRNKHAIWEEGVSPSGQAPPPGFWQMTKVLVRNALPISLIGAALPLMVYLDAFIIGHGLAGADEALRNAVYGEISAGFAIIMLPTVITGALSSAVIPAVAEAVAKKDWPRIGYLSSTAYRTTLLAAWPSALGLIAVGARVYSLLYGTHQGAEYMWVLAMGVVPIMLQQTSSALLQGMGHLDQPLINLGIGTLVKAGMSALLIGPLGGAGVAWGTAIGFAVSATLNLLSVRRLVPAPATGMAWVGNAGRAGLAAVAMGLGTWGLGRLLDPRLPGPWSQRLLTVFLCGVGALLYGAFVLLFRALSQDDLARILGRVPGLRRFAHQRG